MPRPIIPGEQIPNVLLSGQVLLGHVVIAGLLGVVAAFLLAEWLGLGQDYALASTAALAAGVLVLSGLRAAIRRGHPHRVFGMANRVTLARAAAVGLLAGFVFEPFDELRAWSALTLATLAAVLDAVDGRLARKSGLASRFGARFDMETDALMILVLAALAWQWERAGAWVLLAGLMRYGFLLAAKPWPWLGAELSPSRRRQTVCVVQVTGLIIVLVPWLAPAQTAGIAALSLAALCYSFGTDVLELARRPSTEGVPPT